MTREVIVRRILSLGGGVALLCFSTAFTMSMIFSLSQPQLAVAAWGTAQAYSDAAFARIYKTNPSNFDFEESRAYALKALYREPGNIGALRSIALAEAAAGKPDRAKVIMDYALSLSRRDFPANLWQIEYYVAKSDIPHALRYYDYALRTSDEAPGLLFPVLVQAASDPAIAQPLAQMLARRPHWWPLFIDSLLENTKAPAQSLPAIFQALKLDPRVTKERDFLNRALSRLVDAGALPQAHRIYQQASGKPDIALVRDGDFSYDPVMPPFDWQLNDDAMLSGTVGARDGSSNRALHWAGSADSEADVASQRLLLGPGAYRLVATGGGNTQNLSQDVRLFLDCLDNRSIAILPFGTLGHTARTVITSIKVPATGCPSQILRVRVRAVDDLDGTSWIDNIAIVRTAR